MIKGSSGPAPFIRWSIPNVIDSTVCLLPIVSDFSRTILKLEKNYRAGHLPMAGGLLDQPNAFLEAIQFFE